MTDLGDRIAKLVQAIVGPLLEPIDYLAQYPAVIVQQDDDGTLHVTPDDDRIAGMTGVPLRAFLPGVEVKVKAGGRVLVGWENARDPKRRRPVATLFDGGALDSLTITAETKIAIAAAEVDLVSAGGLPIARQGDAVASGGPAVPFTVTLASAVPVVTPTGAGTIAPGTPIVVTFPAPLYGLVTSGRPTVKG